jgi:hypothetical protein
MSNPTDAGPAPFCPSAQPEMDDAVVLGVVTPGETGPSVAYLRDHQLATPEVLAMAAPVGPTEVFRFAARCEGSACRHFDGANCRLVTRIVALLPEVTEALPPCRIRPECRWYKQEGRAACLRCPQVVTQSFDATPLMQQAAEG